MLESLKVKNVALIDESEVEFGKGLNILTGETGAGKSILIDSINLALGAKADKNLIRLGAEYAYVELCFQVTGGSVLKKLKDMEVFPEDGSVILQRRIMPGKSTCKINGETVSGKLLKEAASVLIDIHGQQEHQSLLDERKHFEILDSFCGPDLAQTKEKLAEAYHEYMLLEKQIRQAQQEDGSKEREIALAQFELEEITAAALKEGEDVSLEAEYKRMENIKTIGESVGRAYSCLEENEQGSVSLLLDLALKGIGEAAVYDEALQEHADSLIQMEEMVRDMSRSLQRYLEDLQLDAEQYAYTQERLDTINKLKTKYGNSLQDILAYAQEKQQYLNKFEDFEEYKSNLELERKVCLHKLEELCKQATGLRQKQALLLQKQMKQALLELNFQHVEFEIEVTQDWSCLSRDGDDQVRFMISLNAGEALKPLIQVASGGELSRIMLALKSVMADRDEIETLIFDEIDAGISGRTAWKVSEKLAVLGGRHQVICITHLPQIAAMADCHFMIEKSQTDQQTKTSLTRLDEAGMINEIARLLGSDTVTDAVLQNAKELKDRATGTKKYDTR